MVSIDFKALYPSMSCDAIICAVKEMIMRSRMSIFDVDWREVAKYVAVEVSPEEIEAEGLTLVVPKRKKRRTRHITINYLRQKNNDQKWTMARKPGSQQKKKLLSLAISVGVKKVMSNHTYMVGDDCYLQMGGGAIGLELTGALSRPFMQRWDRIFLEMVKRSGIKMKLYKRYVDDSNQVAKVPPIGAKYDKTLKKVVFDEQEVRLSEKDDARLARILKDIANQVQDGIKMEAEFPSNDAGKMAILDMNVWMDSSNNIVYQYYQKQFASKQILHAQSA